MSKLTMLPDNYNPSHEQRMAKAAFHRRLDELSFMYDESNITKEQVATLAGISLAKLEKWSQITGWNNWMFNHDTTKVKIHALDEIAIDRLHEIMTSPIESGKYAKVTTKDMIKAIELWATLADALPNKRKEVTFLDKELAKMTDEDVQLEKAKIKKKLLTAESV